MAIVFILYDGRFSISNPVYNSEIVKKKLSADKGEKFLKVSDQVLGSQLRQSRV